MSEILIVNLEEYWKSSIKPLGFAEFCEMYDTQGQITGLWEMVQSDPKTGRVKKRVWSKNVVTDQGAVNILQAAIANAVPAAVFNNILITNNSASTTLGAASGTIATTVLNVVALPAALPANTNLIVGYGSGTTQVIPGPTGVTAQGTSGALTVPSWTPSINFPIGTAVVPQPQVADNPNNAGLTSNATTPLSQYSGVIAGGGFVYSATTGAGNRSVVVTFVFKTAANGGSTAIGNYTDEWLVNVSSGATTNNYANHNVNVPMRCDNSNNITSTCTIKL